MNNKTYKINCPHCNIALTFKDLYTGKNNCTCPPEDGCGEDFTIYIDEETLEIAKINKIQRMCLRSDCAIYEDKRCCLECSINCLGRCSLDDDNLNLCECSKVMEIE